MVFPDVIHCHLRTKGQLVKKADLAAVCRTAPAAAGPGSQTEQERRL